MQIKTENKEDNHKVKKGKHKGHKETGQKRVCKGERRQRIWIETKLGKNNFPYKLKDNASESQ